PRGLADRRPADKIGRPESHLHRSLLSQRTTRAIPLRPPHPRPPPARDDRARPAHRPGRPRQPAHRHHPPQTRRQSGRSHPPPTPRRQPPPPKTHLPPASPTHRSLSSSQPWPRDPRSPPNPHKIFFRPSLAQSKKSFYFALQSAFRNSGSI